MTNKSKPTYSIRGKLISAVAMLLVALIMVVSSTYAWFTLSTAPEVTGISTAIGANGALEMALRFSEEGEAQDVREGKVESGRDANTYWGNLVALSSTENGGIEYGVDKITLMPSQLNVTNGIIGALMLSTPKYGPDGRVTDVTPNATTGTYDLTKQLFFKNNDLGFRAVGVASGMTDRQLAYSNAKSAANTALNQAKNTASQSLNTNGSTLANIALKRAADAASTYTSADVASLQAIVNDLLGTENTTGSLQYIETAYKQYIFAIAAGTAGGDGDNWKVVQALVEDEENTLADVVDGLTGVTLPDQLTTAIEAYEATLAAVQSANDGLATLSGDAITWAQISAPLYKLADTEAMEVNGIKAGEVMNGDNMSELVNSVAGGGLTVTMASGGGVYADIADHCGDYNAQVTIEEVEVSGIKLKNMTARMQTDKDEKVVGNGYLLVIGNAMTTLSPEYQGESDTEKPLTEFYGYVIDLAFRTNAAESNLLLQVDAVDRIYNDNNNDATMGGGSSMTFASTSTSFSNEQVADLMENIRIVFFTPDEVNGGGKVLAYARLDVTNATIGADGTTAKMYLTDDAGVARTEDVNVITALAQNEQVNVSALVYLDGTTITNADVVADAAASLVGTANFQFASSANLRPMEYADLHTPNATTSGAATTTEAPVVEETP